MAHGVSINLEKTRRPQLAMSGDAVELVDWDEFVFVFKFQLYKRLALSIRIGRRSAQPGQLNARVAFPTTTSASAEEMVSRPTSHHLVSKPIVSMFILCLVELFSNKLSFVQCLLL